MDLPAIARSQRRGQRRREGRVIACNSIATFFSGVSNIRSNWHTIELSMIEIYGINCRILIFLDDLTSKIMYTLY